MFDARATHELLAALPTHPTDAELAELLARPDLDRIFPAVGLPTALGVRYLAGRTSRDPEVARDPVGRQVVGYFETLLAQQGELDRLLAELERVGPGLVDTAFGRTREYLPPGSELGPVRFVVLPLGFDFRTDRDTVYMDPLSCLAYGPGGIRHTLAHELHHIARYRRTGEALTLMRPEEDRAPTEARAAFRAWATWSEAEGIADRASNMTEWEMPILREAIAVRRQEMDEYGTHLKDLVAAFGATSAPTGEGLRTLETRARRLAHPVGARMAEAIERTAGRAALAECVGRPDRFLDRYDAAARELGRPRIPRSLRDAVENGGETSGAS